MSVTSQPTASSAGNCIPTELCGACRNTFSNVSRHASYTSSRVKRLMLIRIERFGRSTKLIETCSGWDCPYLDQRKMAFRPAPLHALLQSRPMHSQRTPKHCDVIESRHIIREHNDNRMRFISAAPAGAGLDLLSILSTWDSLLTARRFVGNSVQRGATLYEPDTSHPLLLPAFQQWWLGHEL